MYGKLEFEEQMSEGMLGLSMTYGVRVEDESVIRKMSTAPFESKSE